MQLQHRSRWQKSSRVGITAVNIPGDPDFDTREGRLCSDAAIVQNRGSTDTKSAEARDVTAKTTFPGQPRGRAALGYAVLPCWPIGARVRSWDPNCTRMDKLQRRIIDAQPHRCERPLSRTQYAASGIVVNPCQNWPRTQNARQPIGRRRALTGRWFLSAEKKRARNEPLKRLLRLAMSRL